MTCLRCQHGTAKRFGKYGKNRTQRWRCKVCRSTFSEPRPKPLGNHYTSLDRAAQVVSLMTEGMSVRSISRVTEMHKTTILGLLRTVGKNCANTFDRLVQNLRPRYVQADELWTFVHKKERRRLPRDPKEWGDAYVWVALDSETKLVLSYHVGKRDPLSADRFVRDLSKRVVGRFQLTTDGLRTYISLVEEYFGADIDYAQLIKVYGTPEAGAPDWYGTAKVVDVVPIPVSGNPNPNRICTSHVERANLTVRMQLRRFTRLTNGFSKKLRNLKAAVSLYMAWYNFCRVHQALRVTPAMQAGLTDHVWNIGELLSAAV